MSLKHFQFHFSIEHSAAAGSDCILYLFKMCIYIYIYFFWSVLLNDFLEHNFTHCNLFVFCRKQDRNLATPFPSHWRVTTLVCRWSTWSRPSVPFHCSSRSASVTSNRLVSPVYPSTATTNNRLDHITHTDSMKIKLKRFSSICKKEEALKSYVKISQTSRCVSRCWFMNDSIMSIRSWAEISTSADLVRQCDTADGVETPFRHHDGDEDTVLVGPVLYG